MLLVLLCALPIRSARAEEPQASPAPVASRCETPAELIAAYLDCYEPTTQRFAQERFVDLCSEDSIYLLFPQVSASARRIAETPPEAPARQVALEALLRRHGLDPAQRLLEGGELSPAERLELFYDPERSLRHLREVLQGLKAPRALLKELYAFCFQARITPDLEPLKVEAVVVSGERARGKLYQQRTDARGAKSLQTLPFCLIKESGSWRYDLLGLAKELAARLPRRPTPAAPRAPDPAPPGDD